MTPEVTTSSALSLFARPGEGGIRTRKVAFLLADGCDATAVRALAGRLAGEGAVPRFLGPRIGAVEAMSGEILDADASVETTPSVVYDAVVLPDGEAAVKALLANGQALEFVKDQYRHCKTILAVGGGRGDPARGGHPRDAAGRDRRPRTGGRRHRRRARPLRQRAREASSFRA